MDANVYEQFEKLEQKHWWFRGRRTVYGGLLAAILGDERPARILDLGCGVGGFQSTLRGVGDAVIGCDVDAGSLAVCHRRGYTECIQSGSESLPFHDACFDLVCLFDVIEHTPDDRRVLVEVARVLRPGGIVYLSVPAWQFLYANNDRVAGHYRRYSRNQLVTALGDSGFEVIRSSYTNILLFPLILLAVLGSKLVEGMLRSRGSLQHSNLSWRMPKIVNEMLYRIFTAELFLTRGNDFPVGHSLVAAARKPGAVSAR